MIPSYFEDSKTLFPIWPVIDPGAALRLFIATIMLYSINVNAFRKQVEEPSFAEKVVIAAE